MPASVETTAPLPGLSPVADKPIIAEFNADGFSANGGLLTLREVEQRIGIAAHLAAPIADPREPTQVTHQIEDVIRFRMLMIAAGYEDGNDADALRHDPMSSWRWDACRRVTRCVRSRPSRGWRT